MLGQGKLEGMHARPPTRTHARPPTRTHPCTPNRAHVHVHARPPAHAERDKMQRKCKCGHTFAIPIALARYGIAKTHSRCKSGYSLPKSTRIPQSSKSLCKSFARNMFEFTFVTDPCICIAVSCGSSLSCCSLLLKTWYPQLPAAICKTDAHAWAEWHCLHCDPLPIAPLLCKGNSSSPNL